MREALGAHLTPSNLEREAAFFASGIGRTRERPYGWRRLLTPADVLMANPIGWLPAQTYPVRGGLYPNSAFGLLRSYEWALLPDGRELRAAIDDAVRRWYVGDTDYPAHLAGLNLSRAWSSPPRSTPRQACPTWWVATTWSSTGSPPTPSVT